MNKDNIVIRFADEADIESVMLFLKEHWSANHIMANKKDMMVYDHSWNGKFNYVIAEDKTDKKIYGVCGYIPYSYDGHIDISAGIWKVIKSPRFLLGTEILKFVQRETKCRMFVCCGANPQTDRLRTLIGHITGDLHHYYRIADKDKYEVAVIANKNILPAINNSKHLWKIEKYSELLRVFHFDSFKERKPYKDEQYIEHRYFNHIKYKYNVYGIGKSTDKIDSMLIGREIDHNGTKVFRIVDFIGVDNDLREIAWDVQKLIDDNKYEYIDFYCYGIDHEILEAAGFTLRTADDKNIIPNYFEPFEQKNISIHFSTNISEEFYIFKGDGDQDRPNSLDLY